MPRDWIDDLRYRHPLLYATGFQTESYPDGWAWIVRQLAAIVENLIAKQLGPERAYLRYVKEEFGTFVYALAGPVTTEMDRAVRTAIELSRETCQECGAPGVIGSTPNFLSHGFLENDGEQHLIARRFAPCANPASPTNRSHLFVADTRASALHRYDARLVVDLAVADRRYRIRLNFAACELDGLKQANVISDDTRLTKHAQKDRRLRPSEKRTRAAIFHADEDEHFGRSRTQRIGAKDQLPTDPPRVSALDIETDDLVLDCGFERARNLHRRRIRDERLGTNTDVPGDIETA